MPYVQVTSRCNMACRHCCYSCTSRGKDMPQHIFEAALTLDEETVSIGGGEPTIHPLFWQFLGLAMAHCNYVWLATNGKETKTALGLANLARRGVVSVELSIDPWHEPIDEKVIRAFKREQRNDFYQTRFEDLRGIRAVQKISKVGRAADWGDSDECPCEDLFVKPNGDIRQCGCPDAPRLGHVLKPFDRESFVDEHGEIPCCHKKRLVMA